MSLAEGVSARVAYKAYSTGVISSNVQPVSSVDPGASGGQILRRVSSTLKLGKDTYQSEEIRGDRQIADFRHGIKRAQGGVVSGEFSPGTYWDFFEAVLRSTDAAPVALSEVGLTSVAADNTLSTFTFAAGDPVALGLRVGGTIRFTNMSDTDNNNKNFQIVSFGGVTNRTVTVYPAPDTMGADTAFNVAEIGRTLYMPSSGFVSRKFAIEHYHQDIDLARLFTEVRIDGFNIQLPATGLATVDFTGMGRDMEVYGPTAAPFFTSPAAENTNGIFAAVNGQLRIAGVAVGVVTGLNIQAELGGSSDAVVGQNFVPEVFLGRLNVTGQATVMLEDSTFINYFKDETAVSILASLSTTSAVDSPAVSIFLPRVKFGDADLQLQGEGAQILTMPFQALKGLGTVAGEDATTIRFQDTAAV